MSGYKRVNFYELCRLCAKNQQKDKTHIFQEEGRKIHLQNKIQTCLSLKVCENDFLPKVVCSQCLRSLEESCVFRKVCYTSETMLSSYFNNFRFTEDFKKSGKVYIKDSSSKAVSTQDTSIQASVDTAVSATTAGSAAVSYNINVVPSVSSTRENVPYYTLHLPSGIPAQINGIKTNTSQEQPEIAYNLNAVAKASANGALNNLASVDLDKEIAGIETSLNQNIPKSLKRPRKQPMLERTFENGDAIKIDLTQTEPDDKSKIKQSKGGCPFKMENDLKERLVLNSLESSLNQSLFHSSLRMNVNKPTRVYSSYNSSNVLTSVIPTPTSVGNTNINSVMVINSNSISTKTSSDIVGVQLNPDPPPLSLHSQINSSALVNITATSITGDQSSSCIKSSDCNGTAGYANTFDAPNATKNSTGLPNSVTVVSQNSNNRELLQQEDQLAKKHVCDVCQKTFKRREHLYQHVRLHTGFRPFKCENCNKRFMRKEHLLRHMTSHSGQKNFTCNICDKSFSRNDNLLKHKKIHAKQNSFTCEMCQKQFVMEHYYLAHKLTHDNEKCGMNPVWNLLKTM